MGRQGQAGEQSGRRAIRQPGSSLVAGGRCDMIACIAWMHAQQRVLYTPGFPAHPGVKQVPVGPAAATLATTPALAWRRCRGSQRRGDAAFDAPPLAGLPGFCTLLPAQPCDRRGHGHGRAAVAASGGGGAAAIVAAGASRWQLRQLGCWGRGACPLQQLWCRWRQRWESPVPIAVSAASAVACHRSSRGGGGLGPV